MKTIANFFIAFIICNATLFSQDSLVEITKKHNFNFEIRYATTTNFIGEKLYDCEICLLKPRVAEALKEANKYFNQKGYRIKLYDCYRPLDVQKKMWKKVPRPTYVANPYTKGSVHNRGAAIDLTLETLEGCFVDMGTDYDYFGVEAHIDYINFFEEIIANRNLLINGMRKFGFQTIRTEWWHFSYKKNKSYPILNIPLPCEN
ncbi:MAG: M15 family metallopeptidase [Flavobacteriaceae bacterium]|nr:M15 family metallopeptidase [Flavobacteriaceae bacterium]